MLAFNLPPPHNASQSQTSLKSWSHPTQPSVQPGPPRPLLRNAPGRVTDCVFSQSDGFRVPPPGMGVGPDSPKWFRGGAMGFFLLLHFEVSFSINPSTQPPFPLEPTLHSIFKLNAASTGRTNKGIVSLTLFPPSLQHQSFPCAVFLRTSTLGPVARTPLQHNSGCNVHLFYVFRKFYHASITIKSFIINLRKRMLRRVHVGLF